MKKIFLTTLILFLQHAFATGLSKPVLVGPKAIGMGGAFVGVADDPTAIFHNPAGITQLKGHQFELGMDMLISDLDYTPPGSPVEKAKTEYIPVPQFSYVTDHFRPISLGLGVFFPHGNGGKFTTPSVDPFNPNEGRIYSMEISPTMAVELKNLSFGASVRIIRASSSIKGLPLPPDTIDDLDVSGWDYGLAAGMLYRPCKFFSFGANYRTSVDVKLKGSATFHSAPTSPQNVSLIQTLPSIFTTGFAYHPIEPLTLAFSYDFEANSEIGNINATIGGAPLTIPQETWKSSHTIHFGGDYWVSPVLAVRAGYAKDLNDSIPDSVMNRIIGDIAAHEVSAGAAYKWNRYTFSGTWNGRFGKRDIPNNGANPAPGNYDAFVNELSMAVQVAL